MQHSTITALDTLVTTAELTAGFAVQVADGERVSYVTGTKMDSKSPVVFSASISERMNGSLDIRAQVMASDGEQATFATLDELVEWVSKQAPQVDPNVEASKVLLARVAGNPALQQLLDDTREQTARNDADDSAYGTTAARRVESVMGHLQMVLDAAELYRSYQPRS